MKYAILIEKTDTYPAVLPPQTPESKWKPCSVKPLSCASNHFAEHGEPIPEPQATAALVEVQLAG